MLAVMRTPSVDESEVDDYAASMTTTIAKRAPLVKLTGRVLYLSKDLEQLEAQLHGEITIDAGFEELHVRSVRYRVSRGYARMRRSGG